MTLGQELYRLRERGWYRHRVDLAARACVSVRTVELVESDAVLPTSATLAKLLKALGASPQVAQRLRRLRDRIDAERRGFDVPELDQLLPRRLAEAASSETAWCLRRRRVPLTDGDVRAMTAAIQKRLGAILRPADQSNGESTNVTLTIGKP